jgi:ubiquinone/menaquinone biosynthesis C-methylase UbiE
LFGYPIGKSEALIFKSYYSNYLKNFSPRMRFNFNRNTQEVMELIQSSKVPLSVLELGSGTGIESLWMAINGAKVVGIDIREDRLLVARKLQEITELEIDKKLDCQFINSNIMNFEDNNFDILWLEMSFHHLEPREKILKKI